MCLTCLKGKVEFLRIVLLRKLLQENINSRGGLLDSIKRSKTRLQVMRYELLLWRLKHQSI